LSSSCHHKWRCVNRLKTWNGSCYLFWNSMSLVYSSSKLSTNVCTLNVLLDYFLLLDDSNSCIS
jgi:hypothetical protein